MRAIHACVATLLACAAPCAEAGDPCTPVMGGMQFCAEVVGSPRVGERVKLALETRNVELDRVSAFSLAKIPGADRTRLIWVWVNKRPPRRANVELRPEYVVHMKRGDRIRAEVTIDYVATRGRNELFVEIPYWEPAGPPFTKAEILAFHESAWPAPMVPPLIGPLVFEAR